MRKIDFTILIPAIFLVVMGTSQIISYTSGRMLLAHFAALGGGFAGMFIFSLTKYKVFIRFRAITLYVLGILLLLAVLSFGRTVRGSCSWLNIGIVVFQPSELVKFTTIIFLTYYFSRNYIDRGSPRTVFFTVLFGALPFALVLKQPDVGTAMVFLFIIFVFLYFSQNINFLMFLVISGGIVLIEIIYFCLYPAGTWSLYLAGAAFFAVLYLLMRFLLRIKKAHVLVLSLGSLFVLSLLFSWKVTSMLKPYQKNRILNFIKPSRDTLNSGYHLSQSLITIGSGKLTGKGYRMGSQARLGFLPGKYTDFIFASIAEEFGFLGVLLILISYFVLYLRIIKISMLAIDQQGTFLTLAIFAILFFQTVLNIGMTLGIMPITGLPLPFVSYGGTALVVYLSMLGIVMNVGATAEGW